MNKTSIEWTTFSGNPLKYRRKSDGKVAWGCVKISPGCAHCYSESLTLRYNRGKLFNAANMEELEPFLDEAELHKMLTAKTIGGVRVSGSRCFVGDMTDIFGEWVSDELLDRLFAVFAIRRDVTWQILTKRAERMRDYLTQRSRSAQPWKDAARSIGYSLEFRGFSLVPFPLPNVWLGVSCENQEQADKRIPLLLQVPAVVHWVSAEPLLGPIIFEPWWLLSDYDRYCIDDRFGIPVNANRAKVSWIVAGGESGPKSRPCKIEWIRDIVAQCKAASVPVFVKQIGANPIGDERPPPVYDPVKKTTTIEVMQTLEINDKKGGEMTEWPEDLRIREFPK